MLSALQKAHYHSIFKIEHPTATPVCPRPCDDVTVWPSPSRFRPLSDRRSATEDSQVFENQSIPELYRIGYTRERRQQGRSISTSASRIFFGRELEAVNLSVQQIARHCAPVFQDTSQTEKLLVPPRRSRRLRLN